MKVKNHSKHDALALAVRNGHTHVGELIAKALGVCFCLFFYVFVHSFNSLL